MATSIFFRKGTAAHWAATNPVLRDGEPGWEKDTGKLKIGDGVTAWNDLTYFSSSSGGGDILPVLELDGINNTGNGHDSLYTTWKDLSGTVGDATKTAGNLEWGSNNLRLDGSSYWSIDAPNNSKGTMEIVVAVDSDFIPIDTTLWYNASCIFGTELGGSQQDFGILVDRLGNFAIGYGNSTIYSSTINSRDGLPHTITYSYFRGPVTFHIDGILIAEIPIACAGSEVGVLGIGWNKMASNSRVKCRMYSVKWFKELLTTEQALANHNSNKVKYGF